RGHRGRPPSSLTLRVSLCGFRCVFRCVFLCVFLCVLCSPLCPCHDASAQQPVGRLKGRVVTDRGERIQDADVRAEAVFGVAAGTFAGQRTFSTKTNAKGEWSILGIMP